MGGGQRIEIRRLRSHSNDVFQVMLHKLVQSVVQCKRRGIVGEDEQIHDYLFRCKPTSDDKSGIERLEVLFRQRAKVMFRQ